MRKEFEVVRTHRYGKGPRNEVAVEFNLRGRDFNEVKKRVKKEFGLDDPEKAMFTGIQTPKDTDYQLELQSGETCELTDGARINVLMQKGFDGTIKTHIKPNHHIWPSSRSGLENVSRGIKASLQSFLEENK